MAEQGFVGALHDESARWVQEGLLTEAQRQAILGRYPAPAAGGRDRTVLIFSILGALLLGTGVILFFAANWPQIPATIKVGMILAATIGAYAGGYHLQYTRGDYPRLGHSLIFLGSLFYGAGIWLIAQIFHLDSHYPTGFLLWGVGILPVAAVTASRPVLGLGTLLVSIWTIGEQAGFEAVNYLFPVVMLGVVMPLSRRLQTALVEAAVLAGVYLWFGINTGRVTDSATVVFALLTLYGVAVMLLGLGRAGDERAYLGVGSLGMLMGSYFLTFDLHRSPLAYSPYVMVGFGVILAAAAAGAWLYWRRGEAGRQIVLPAVLAPGVAALVSGLLAPVPQMILFNLVLFGSTVGLVVFGIQRHSRLLVNMAIIAFVIHVITRYFDLFFSAMNRSLFFMIGGLLLLGGGWLLERNRRRWLQDWGGGNHAA